MTNVDRYPVKVLWSDEDEGFIALPTDLPGCSAFGETREAACREVLPAIKAWISAAKKAGNVVPSPSKPNMVKVINVFDPAVIGSYLSAEAGERVIMNVIHRNGH